METKKDRDTANAAPQNDWRNAAADERTQFAEQHDDPKEEEAAEEEEDNRRDWGHVDPNEGNSPFPDSNDPSGPGSAV